MISTRSYHLSDYPQIKNLLTAAQMFDPVRDSQQNLQKKIQLDPESIIVAVHNHTIVGSAYIMYDGVFAFIFRLVVQKECQKKGIGSQLLAEAEARLKKKGAQRVAIWVLEPKLPFLKNFYEKRGYTTIEHKHQCMIKDF